MNREEWVLNKSGRVFQLYMPNKGYGVAYIITDSETTVREVMSVWTECLESCSNGLEYNLEATYNMIIKKRPNWTLGVNEEDPEAFIVDYNHDILPKS